MGQAKECLWYHEGKLRDLRNLGTFEYAVVPDTLVVEGKDMYMNERDRGVGEWDPKYGTKSYLTSYLYNIPLIIHFQNQIQPR